MKYSKWFRKIAKGKTSHIDVRFGLCYHFQRDFGERLTNIMYREGISYDQWPEYSGSRAYPIKAPEGYACDGVTDTQRLAVIFYNEYAGSNMYEGEYGEARRRLAMWLAIEFFKRGM